MVLRQRVFLGLVLVVNVATWAVPDDVFALVAHDRPVLLGRYSLDRFQANLAVTLLSLVGLYIDRAPPGRYKRRWFQVLAVAVFLVPAVVVIDTAARYLVPPAYVNGSLTYHRPPRFRFTHTYVDQPASSAVRAHLAEGHAPVACTYRADDRGFRNAEAMQRCDIVVLGDSFTEGNEVSDEHPWPVRLAELTGARVYNLGMSGYEPVNYLASLRDIGVSLHAVRVICMFYEGNDFGRTQYDLRTGRIKPEAQRSAYIDRSPLLQGIEALLMRTVGRLGAGLSWRDFRALSWLPLEIPAGAGAKLYAFGPKALTEHLEGAQQFRDSGGWRRAVAVLDEMKRTCEDVGAELVVALAPTKAHVVLPLAADVLDAASVREVALLRADALPPPREYLLQLVSRLDTRENVVRDWCDDRGVAFVSLTGPLRTAAAGGTQVYYTYDHHWTPAGHAVAAQALAAVIASPRPRRE